MIMKILSKIDTWFSDLDFKWQVAIAMAALFLVMVIIISFAGA